MLKTVALKPFLALAFFLHATGAFAENMTLEEFLVLRKELGKHLVFDSPATEIGETLAKAASLPASQRLEFFEKLGKNNLSYFLLTRRPPQVETLMVDASVGAIIQIARFRGSFGQSLVLPRDIEEIILDTRQKDTFSGRCRINVLDAIKVDLAFSGHVDANENMHLTTVEIVPREGEAAFVLWRKE